MKLSPRVMEIMISSFIHEFSSKQTFKIIRDYRISLDQKGLCKDKRIFNKVYFITGNIFLSILHAQKIL